MVVERAAGPWKTAVGNAPYLTPIGGWANEQPRERMETSLDPPNPPTVIVDR